MANENAPLLTIRFDGDAIDAGEIPLSILLRFLLNMRKTMRKIGENIHDELDDARKSRLPKALSDELELKLVSLDEGSPAAVLEFERHGQQFIFSELDLCETVLAKMLDGLRVIQEHQADDALPPGYDSGVLKNWSEAGAVFAKGVEKIEFALNGRETAAAVSFSGEGAARIRKRISNPTAASVQAVQGRLLMADFKESNPRCRVHPFVGDPVTCYFDEEQRDEVRKNILRHVRIEGESEEDPPSGKIKSIKVDSIEPIDAEMGEGIADEFTEIAGERSFWETVSIEELARLQDVRPLEDVRELFGTWPGEEDDGFEEAVDRLRHV